jgi:hypothetical protein
MKKSILGSDARVCDWICVWSNGSLEQCSRTSLMQWMSNIFSLVSYIYHSTFLFLFLLHSGKDQVKQFFRIFKTEMLSRKFVSLFCYFLFIYLLNLCHGFNVLIAPSAFMVYLGFFFLYYGNGCLDLYYNQTKCRHLTVFQITVSVTLITAGTLVTMSTDSPVGAGSHGMKI